MNVLEYVPLMKSMGTPIAIAGIAILAVFLIILIIKMLGGMIRGFWRQLVRTAMTVVSAIASFTIVKMLSGNIINRLDETTIEGLIARIEPGVPQVADILRNAMASFSPENLAYIILLPAVVLVLPILATVIFLLLNLILKIIRAIIIKILHFKKAQNNTERLGGALLAAVEGIVWMTMIILPLSATLSLVDTTYQEAINANESNEDSAIVTVYEENVMPLTQNPVFTITDAVGGRFIANSIATVSIDGEDANMRDEILSVAHIILVEAPALKGADLTAPTEEQKCAVSNIIDSLAQSPYMSRMLVSIAHALPAMYESGIIPTSLGEQFPAIIDNMMTFFKEVSRESLGDDLNTLKKFYFGFCDSGIITAIKNGEDIMKLISDDHNGDRHILGMVNSLSGNPRTQGIVDGLYNLVLSAAFGGSADNGDSDGSLDINISDVKDGLNDIIAVKKENFATEEEYKEELSNTISTTIKDTVGVELEKEVVDEISDYVDQNYSEKMDELTDEEFNELMFEVIDIYQGVQNGEEINPDDLEDILGDKIPQ